MTRIDVPFSLGLWEEHHGAAREGHDSSTLTRARPVSMPTLGSSSSQTLIPLFPVSPLRSHPPQKGISALTPGKGEGGEGDWY